MFKESLSQFLENGYKVFIYGGSQLQKSRLTNMLSQFPEVTIFEESISSGFSIIEEKLVVICNHEIFGRRKEVIKTLHKVQTSPSTPLLTLRRGLCGACQLWGGAVYKD